MSKIDNDRRESLKELIDRYNNLMCEREEKLREEVAMLGFKIVFEDKDDYSDTLYENDDDELEYSPQEYYTDTQYENDYDNLEYSPKDYGSCTTMATPLSDPNKIGSPVKNKLRLGRSVITYPSYEEMNHLKSSQATNWQDHIHPNRQEFQTMGNPDVDWFVEVITKIYKFLYTIYLESRVHF